MTEKNQLIYIGDAALITREHVEKVLDSISTRYEYLVLDLPHDLNNTTLAGISSTEEFLLLMAPELASVKTMAGLLEVFDRFELSREQMHIVMNWIFKNKGLARSSIESALKQRIEFVIPYVSDAFISATNLGIPPALGSISDPIRVLFEDLAWFFSKAEDKVKKPSAPTETLRRVLKRKAASKVK